MIENFGKYWHGISRILLVGCIFDHRFQIRLVEYYFSMIYGNDATSHVQIVHGDGQSIVKEYKTRYASVASSLRYSSNSLSISHSMLSLGSHRSST